MYIFDAVLPLKVGPTFGILDPICWDFYSRCTCLDSTAVMRFSIILDLEMDFTEVFTLYYSKLCKVVSRFGLISARRGITQRPYLSRGNSKLTNSMFLREVYSRPASRTCNIFILQSWFLLWFSKWALKQPPYTSMCSFSRDVVPRSTFLPGSLFLWPNLLCHSKRHSLLLWPNFLRSSGTWFIRGTIIKGKPSFILERWKIK